MEHGHGARAGCVADHLGDSVIMRERSQCACGGAAEDHDVGLRGGDQLDSFRQVVFEHAQFRFAGDGLEENARRADDVRRREIAVKIPLHDGVGGGNYESDAHG